MADKKDNLIQFPEVSVVEASAGSGKTYALASRYLKLLLDPRHPLEYVPLRTILAITFTNKAMIEMKERILEFLKKIALDAYDSKEEKQALLEQLGLNPDFAREKAALVMDFLIDRYNFFQVQTIDSFINTLLLGSALNIDRSASFTIKRDYMESLAFCLDLTIEYAAENEDVYSFLEEFLEHYLFVENRNGWFPKQDILELVQSLFRLRNKYGRPFKIYPGKSSEVISAKKNIYKKIKDIREDLPEGFNASAGKHILGFLEKSNEIFDISDLPAALRKKEPPLNKGKTCSAQFSDLWQDVFSGLKNLVELDSRVAYKPYIRVFNNLISFFQTVSKKEDVLFLEELNRTARSLFGNDGITVAELYYRLATRFRHYLIDEFQDTSDLQWRNLEMMIEEALSTGGTLFYVGDKKQAIYRFRGGEIKLFDRVREKFSAYNLRSRSLTRNWRSQKAIVDFNNSVFSQDNLGKAVNASGIADELDNAPEAMARITDIFKDSFQGYKPEKSGGYVRIKRIDEKNQAERDEILKPEIVQTIKKLRLRKFSYQDIAILTRDNNEVELLTSWLLAEAIPAESEKTLNVLENPLIKELVAFLAFLHSPIDDLSFASFISGEIFSRVSGIPEQEIRDFLFFLHVEGKNKGRGAVYRFFRDKYPEAWTFYLEPFFKTAGFISTYELVTSIYRNLGLCSLFPGNLAFFMKFIELIKEKEDECSGMGELLAYLPDASPDELYVCAPQSDSVKVLTIHKSKGLEFPVVIIPFLRMDITPATGGKGTSSYVEDEDGPDLGLLRITRNHRAYSQALNKVYARSYLKSAIDELNNMYVALTRAEVELYVYLPKKSGARKNPARFFIPEDINELGCRENKKTVKSQKEQPLIRLEVPEFRDWIKVLEEEFTDKQEILKKENIIKGMVLHEIFSRIKKLEKEKEDRIVTNALTETKLLYPQIKEDSFYRDKILSLISDPGLSRFFYLDKEEVFCEKEIVNKFGDTKRIDRLIVGKDKVRVIDYKSSGKGEKSHKKQVREYMALVSALYPGREVKGFIIYFDELKVEEIPGAD